MSLPRRFRLSPLLLATVSPLLLTAAARAQTGDADVPSTATLPTVTIDASADASAGGLSKPYAGGQVARGGRVGFLGTRDDLETPFSMTSYTSKLIQDRQARSVGDVLLNDPGVRVARGFGNFQESYFIRGFVLGSDDVAYNGLYGLLPRQYVSAELFERVEVLRGANAFLNGATPGNGGIGGAINLLPKRAPADDLNRVTLGASSGGQGHGAVDLSRRFGPDGRAGVRLNAVRREGGTGVDNENVDLGMVSVGLDWRDTDLRLSADIGHQEYALTGGRPNVTLAASATRVPDAPDNRRNYAQPWSYSRERDTFGTVRGEYDLAPKLTAWAAFGLRETHEANSLANLTVSNANTGAATTYRADNRRDDSVKSGEAGLRGSLQTGSIGHELVAAASMYSLQAKNAYAWSNFASPLATSLYHPVVLDEPAATYLVGGRLDSPLTTRRDRLTSIAVSDTLSMFDDSVRLTLGARNQSIDTRTYSYNTGAQQTHYDKSRVTPAAGLVIRLRPALSLYANYIEALVQGDTAGSNAVNAGETFAPYVSRQKEIGVKYDAGRIGGTLALFATSKPSGYLDPVTRYYGVEGKDRHRGIELTVHGEAMPGLRLLGGLTVLDAEQQQTAGGSNDGNKVIGVPGIQGSVGAEWDVPWLAGLALDARLIATGHSYANAANTLRAPGWSRLDIGARYLTEIGGKLVTWRARIDNVANRDYWSSVGGYPGNGYLVQGAPRTFSATATVDF